MGFPLPTRLTRVSSLVLIILVGLLIALGLSIFRDYLGTRLSGIPLTQNVIGGALKSDSLTIGNHTLEFRGRTRDNQQLAHQVSFAVRELIVPPSGPAREVNHEFDTYISETAVPIFSAYELGGPVDAALTVRVRTHTEPVVEISAEARYVYPTAEKHNPAVPESYKGNWVVSNIQTTGGGAAVAAPILATVADDTSSGTHKSLLTLTVSQRYRATVTITGRVVDGDVAPVLLPRFRSAPFVGPKKIVVIKGRYADEPLPNKADVQRNAPYGANNAVITDKIGRVEAAYEHMSNGKVPVEYDIREATFSAKDISRHQPGLAAGVCPFGEVGQRLFESVGIPTEHHTEYADLVLISLYESSAQRLMKEFACKLPVESGGTRLAWVTFKDPDALAIPHGLGHGLEMNHVFWNGPSLCDGMSPDPRTPSIEHVYTSRRPQAACAAIMAAHGHAMGWAWTPAVYYHQMDRASVGWLTEGQVGLSTESGIYDLYSERDDNSASPDDPLILQVPVEIEGYVDFVYLTLVNQGVMTADGPDAAMLTDALQGVRLTAGGTQRTTTTKQGSYISHVWQGPDFYDATMPIGRSVHLNWPNTNVRLEVLSVVREDDRTHAKIKVTMNDVPAPGTAAPLPAPVSSVTDTVPLQPTLRWQSVEGAARYFVRIYSVVAGDNPLASEIMVTAPATEVTVPRPLKNLNPAIDYYWNVQAIDAEGNGGQWSALQRLNVQ